MRTYRQIAVLAALFCAAAAGAQAHPGSKILTTGSGEQTAMTDGMSYEDVSGVHIFRGSPASSDDTLPSSEAGRQQIKIQISVTPAFRRIRHLRTQGFYSGAAYPSRRYTRGFYSGR